MKTLNILRSEPDDLVRILIDKTSAGDETAEIPLYLEEVDYDLLIKEIFESERVISWW